MRRLIFIIPTILVLTISFSLPVLADPPKKDFSEAQRKKMEQESGMIKKDQERQKEMRKHSEEIERENRKHSEEMERENHKHREVMRREARKHREEIGRKYRNHPDFYRHPGYRERPYEKSRHYEQYDHKGRRYDYHGHWVSWEQWDRYARKHPEIYKNGRYYHENAHLMFRFRDPDTGNCIFFSIGR